MRIFEIYKSKDKNKVVVPPPPRNLVAKNAKSSGAGSHSDSKFNRKEKHKRPPHDT